MHSTRLSALVFTVVTLAAAPGALAQPPQAKPAPPGTATPRPRAQPTRPAAAARPLYPVFIAVDGLYQATTNDFTDTATFTEFAESGEFDADYEVSTGGAFNIAGGVALWRNIGASAALTRFSTSSPAAIDASIPHPFFFDRDRAVEGTVDGDREELAIHLAARASVPLTRTLELHVFGGPSIFRVKQDVVTDFTYTHTFPFDTAAFQSGEPTEARETAIGFHAGASVNYFFRPQIGVGFTAQFARASADVPAAFGGEQSIDAGGLQVGGGLRLRFRGW